MICHDDTNWFYNTDVVLGYELDCIYESISSINLVEASALYVNKFSPQYWSGINFSKYDCQYGAANGVQDWLTLKLNYTYSTQKECDRTLVTIAGYRQGAFCRLRKQQFLKQLIFKTNRYLLEGRPDIYPYPYAFLVRYTCN